MLAEKEPLREFKIIEGDARISRSLLTMQMNTYLLGGILLPFLFCIGVFSAFDLFQLLTCFAFTIDMVSLIVATQDLLELAIFSSFDSLIILICLSNTVA